MKSLVTVLILFSSLAFAKIDLPKFANPNCVLGLDYKYTNDKENDVLSGYHKDGLHRLLTWSLTEDKKYYVVILKADEAPLKLSLNVSVDLKNGNELSCSVTSKFSDGEVNERTHSKVVDGVLPLSQEAFMLCHDLIFTKTFRERTACK